MPEITIILVGDKRSVVEDLNNLINPYISELEEKHKITLQIKICTSAINCLEIVTELNQKGRDLAGVICSFEMTGPVGVKDGIQLLKKIAQINPKTHNSVIIAWDDYKKATGEIGGKTHWIKYIEKPVTQEPLVKSIDASIDRFLNKSRPVIRTDGFTFKEVETAQELEMVFRLTYDVYVEELKKCSNSNISAIQKQNKQKWDKYDFRADTRQVIAKKNEMAIGRVRIVYGDIPLETEFSIPENFMGSKTLFGEYESKGILPTYLTREKLLNMLNRKTEVSKLMMRKEFRSKGLYLGLLRFVYHFIKNEGDTYISAFKKLEKFYGKMGFRKMGEFTSHELNYETISALHFFVPDVVSNPNNYSDTGLNHLFTQCIKTPVPQNRLEDLIYQAKIIALGGKETYVSWFQKNKARGNKVLQALGIYGEY